MAEEIIEEPKKEDDKPAFDADSFKKDILESVAATNRQMMEAVLASKTVKEDPIEEPSPSLELEEFKTEMEEIGIDDKQAKGMLKLMEKFLGKQAPSFKKEVMTEVDRNLTLKDQKQGYTTNTRMMYPDVDNQGSPLFQMAKNIYREMSDTARSAPDSEAIAVERAAARLGIRPVTIDDLKARDAVTRSGDGSVGDKKKNELDKKFASFFNVDYDKANKKFTSIGQNQKH